MSAGLVRQDFAAMKILPGAERRCGDFLAQTRRARPCLPQRFNFADTNAKMNERELGFEERTHSLCAGKKKAHEKLPKRRDYLVRIYWWRILKSYKSPSSANE